jgi:hypothetical protein
MMDASEKQNAQQRPAGAGPQERADPEELNRLRYLASNMSNRWASIRTALGYVSVLVDETFTVKNVRNATALLGCSQTGVHVAELFGTDSARRYFEAIEQTIKKLEELPEAFKYRKWKRVYTSGHSGAEGFTSWNEFPSGTWEKGHDQARTILNTGSTDQGRAASSRPPLDEYFLVSPFELVGPSDDFRVSYRARAGGRAGDLSLVVGNTPVTDDAGHKLLVRPEENGYCFAFGSYDNRSTELQRCVMPARTPAARKLITPGRDHACLAERIGGVLRFEVDGEEVYRVVDALPLMGGGQGYVSFYTCAADSRFRDLEVWTRPTCIDLELASRIEGLRRVTLETNGPARYVEAHYLERISFVFKDVTEVIEERQRLEVQRHHAAKMEAFLNLAVATAHEMSQPLTVILGQVEFIISHTPEDASEELRFGLSDLQQSTHRLTAIVNKLRNVKDYVTVPYVGETRMVDLDASSGTCDDSGTGRRCEGLGGVNV